MNALDPAAARALKDRLACLTALQFTNQLESVQALRGLLDAYSSGALAERGK